MADPYFNVMVRINYFPTDEEVEHTEDEYFQQLGNAREYAKELISKSKEFVEADAENIEIILLATYEVIEKYNFKRR